MLLVSSLKTSKLKLTLDPRAMTLVPMADCERGFPTRCAWLWLRLWLRLVSAASADRAGCYAWLAAAQAEPSAAPRELLVWQGEGVGRCDQLGLGRREWCRRRRHSRVPRRHGGRGGGAVCGVAAARTRRRFR